MNKAMIAMSGGVDSSVAALLTLQQGMEAVGATMRLLDGCGENDIHDAESVCRRLGIEHRVFDMRGEFDREVMRRFADAYLGGETPNPCIICNRFIKFGSLLDRATESEFDHIVTGHYASVRYDAGSGRWHLVKAADHAKDQTYFLYMLSQEQLSRILFPVGELTKPEVRELAESNGFVTSRKHDSQDICFVPDGDYVGFLKGYRGLDFPAGDFLDLSGNVIGRHSGAVRYTIGQRKGLGMGFNKPMYVCRKDMAANTVTLGGNDDLFSRRVIVRNINMMAVSRIDGPVRAAAKIRYSQGEAPATLIQTGEDELTIEFDTPQRAVAPGQAAVCYDGDCVICGGRIVRGEN